MRAHGSVRVLAGMVLLAGLVAVMAPSQSAEHTDPVLTQAETERIRRSLERMKTTHEQMLAMLDAIAAELAIAKVRATR